MTGPDPQELHRLLGELAGEAPVAVDRGAIAGLAARRRARLLTGAASVVAIGGFMAVVALQPASVTDTLEPAPAAAAPEPSPTPSRQAEPSVSPAPPRTDPNEGPPATVYAAQGSRVGSFRTSDGARTSWLSPERDGYGADHLALWNGAVLYGLGNGETRGVYAIGRPARGDAGPGSLSDPGGFYPAVLPDGARYAFLVTGNDSAYTPPDPSDLRLVLTQESGGVQGVVLEASNTVNGLAFASPDRLALASEDRLPGVMGLRVYDFQTDEAPLGSRAPDERFLAAPSSCSWSLPTATPTADEVLVLQRCENGGSFDAVLVDITSGAARVFGAVLGDGPGQVDSLDLDRTGKHLIAQIHHGALPPAPGSSAGGEPDGPVLVSRSLPGGRTVTTTTSLVSPVWD